MPESDIVVTKTSPRSVDDTVSRLASLATGKGLKVFAVIDHGGEAAEHGLDLPLKVLVHADRGETKVSYWPPGALAARYGLGEQLAERLAGIDALTNAVVEGS